MANTAVTAAALAASSTLGTPGDAGHRHKARGRGELTGDQVQRYPGDPAPIYPVCDHCSQHCNEAGHCRDSRGGAGTTNSAIANRISHQH